jgi:hypothetical protein
VHRVREGQVRGFGFRASVSARRVSTGDYAFAGEGSAPTPTCVLFVCMCVKVRLCRRAHGREQIRARQRREALGIESRAKVPQGVCHGCVSIIPQLFLPLVCMQVSDIRQSLKGWDEEFEAELEKCIQELPSMTASAV